MPINMHEGKNKVLFFRDREIGMSSPALTSITRSALGVMVEQEARKVGSRDVAYENVARTIGMSASWIKKFLRDTGEVSEPRITLFQKIRASYDNICLQVERQNRADELRLQALKGQMNAVTAGMGEEGLTQVSNLVGKRAR